MKEIQIDCFFSYTRLNHIHEFRFLRQKTLKTYLYHDSQLYIAEKMSIVFSMD